MWLSAHCTRTRFQPTPSARRVTRARYRLGRLPRISTHTLRKEGDMVPPVTGVAEPLFQPTPSARRVTGSRPRAFDGAVISTHTLRKEGDSGS